MLNLADGPDRFLYGPTMAILALSFISAQADSAFLDAVMKPALCAGVGQGRVPESGYMFQRLFESSDEVSCFGIVRAHLVLERFSGDERGLVGA